jgi:mRNA-degrading endonuclease toxin of MazEF toxin-antitoxin module
VQLNLKHETKLNSSSGTVWFVPQTQRQRVSLLLATALLELGRIKSGDVVLPAQSRSGQPDKRIRLRCVTAADEAQKVLLNRLGLTLPQRLRRIDERVQM